MSSLATLGKFTRERGRVVGEKIDRTGKRVRPKIAERGKRYLCAKCRKRSPRPVFCPAPWYCPKCSHAPADATQ